MSVSGLNRELQLLLLLRLRLGSWWWFSSCSSQQHRTRPLQLRLSSPSWLSFRLRSLTSPPMDISSNSPTPSCSRPSPSSESAVVTAGIVGIELKKNDNGQVKPLPLIFWMKEPCEIHLETCCIQLTNKLMKLFRISYQLSALTATSLVIIFVVGLVIKVLLHVHSTPLTFSYIGAFGTGKNRAQLSVTFQLSMMHFGQGSPVAASGLAIVMGLNLLEVIEHQLPSFFNNFDPRAAAANFPSSNARMTDSFLGCGHFFAVSNTLVAYLAGLTIALAASPCSTPVLATLLGYVATSRDPVVGGSLLLTYTTGYVAPLIPAASFARVLQVIMCTIVFNK
ncbi:unnamed protein product [Brassica oleracea]